MSINVCKFNKFSHCKFGKYCHFKHENKKCQNNNCDAKSCDLRHPKNCRNILQKKVCSFGDFCSFEHRIDPENSSDVANSTTEYTHAQKIQQLEKALGEKNRQIEALETKIVELQNHNLFNQSDSDLETSTSSGSLETDFLENKNKDDDEGDYQENNFEVGASFACEKCSFVTEHRVGLKIHQSKAHLESCEYCGKNLKTKDRLRRHMKMEETLEMISDKKTRDSDLELKQLADDEVCLGIVSLKDPRDDGLPVLYLHCEECWTKSGHFCPHLPLDRKPQEDDVSLPIEDSFLLDYDKYNPTKHVMMEWLVVGDITMPGCYPDWDVVKKILDSK